MLVPILWILLFLSFSFNVGFFIVGKDLKKRLMAAEKNVRNSSSANY